MSINVTNGVSIEFVGDNAGMEMESYLAIATVAAFTLGWFTHRYLVERRERAVIEQLTDRLNRAEQQRDAAHRAALNLSATHARLMGEHQETEWIIRSLRSELRIREAKIGKLAGSDVRFGEQLTIEDFGSEDAQYERRQTV